jgi:hypothetical protein
MAYKIVNTEDDLPKRIFQFRLSQFKGHLTKNFLEMIVRPIQGPGIKRDNYFIIRTDSVYQFNQETIETKIFMRMLTHSVQRGCQYTMVIDK